MHRPARRGEESAPGSRATSPEQLLTLAAVRASTTLAAHSTSIYGPYSTPESPIT